MNNDLLNYMEKSLLKEKDGIIIDINDNFFNLTQFNRNELCGKSITEVLNKLFRYNPNINTNCEEVETILFTKTLDVRFVKVKRYDHFDNNINLYIFDEIENSRLDNKILFIENLINDNKMGIGIYTANDIKLIKANQKYLDYLQNPYNTKEVAYGKCISEFIHYREKNRAKDFFANIVKTNKSVYVTEMQGLMLEDSDYWDNTITPISENGEVKYIMSMLENVTERVQSRKHIKSKNIQLESIIESVDDIIGIVDKDGKYLKHNSLMKSLFGENKDRLIGYSTDIGTYYDLTGNPIPLNELCFMNLLKGVKLKGQKVKYVLDAKEYYLHLSAIPLFDENGQLEMGVIVTHDITHIIENNNRIKLEQQLTIKGEQEKLEVAEKTLAMKDEFISLISHEFKTPINVIYSAIQLIECAYFQDIPDKVKALMQNIKQNTFRQLRLVNNLLDITRLNAGNFKLNINNVDIVSLTRQIAQSVKIYSNQKNIKLLFISSLNYRNIATDDEKLERIMLNLISNAIKFTNQDGTVSISLDENKETNMIVIEVSDTGIGIPKDKQDLIFERFGQVDSNLSRHAEGTGIGLSLVYKLVNVLNGQIELESELGSGSTFRITLPANQHIEKEKNAEFINGENRLVNALNVEFSDIYL